MILDFWHQHFGLLLALAAVLFVFGLSCILLSRNLIRILLGVELLTKAVTLLLVLGGAITGRMALAQALVITLIVMEVVAIVVAAGIVVGVYGHTGRVSAADLRELKG